MRKEQKSIYPMTGEKKGSVTLEYLTSVNYAMHHNHNRTLVKCEITNNDEEEWNDITVTVSGSMIHTHTTHLTTISPDTTVDITDEVSIDIDPEELIQLSESISTYFSVNVKIGDNEVFAQQFPLQLMPYDQWTGTEIRPELLASFVTPNHPVISRVCAAASKYMLQFTGNADLDEYQSQDPNRVRAQIAAVFEALRSESLIYASVPPSFEKSGQRIRTVDKVLDEKLGTCLDLSLLAASCIEALGINPLLVLTEGHCMVGAWLVKDSYVHPVGDDAEYLLKSGSDGINEILVMESTMLTTAQSVNFDQATEMALNTLRHNEMICFIDVYRARVNGIKPLPLRIKDADRWTIKNEGIDHTNDTKEVKEYDRYDLTGYASDNVKITKYALWERKLLDFTLRNNLLNMRLGKKIIPLVSYGIDRLEDMIEAKGTFQVLPFPLDTQAKPSETGLYDSSQYPQLQEFTIKELDNKRVHSFLGTNDLKEALKYVYRASRTSLEENGANNLYLVLGVLKWYETDKSQKPRFAPILLLPIEIVRSGGMAGYTIRTRDEETVLNITLSQLLKQQYDIDLTVLDELPKDESGVDVKKIFAIVRDKVRGMKGWNVLDESVIGLFSFNKFVMWNDIHVNSAKLKENDIISSLVEGKLNIKEIDQSIDASTVDKERKPADFTIPIDVDSSQLEAVIASGAGQSFILHGPPGTGKSQTITNMIANALYQGKRVLFVAEKMAALSVVQSRLEKIGLAPFCLELHSNKVTKRHFLAQMEAALEVTHLKSPADFKLDSEEKYALRQQLICYIESLHAKGVNGLSLYDCITNYLCIDGDTMPIDIEWFGDIDRRGIDKICESIAQLDTVFRIAGKPNDSALHDLDITDGTAEAEKKLKSALSSLKGSLKIWNRGVKDLQGEYGVTIPDNTKGIRWAMRLINHIMSMPYCSSALLRISSDGRKIERLKKAVTAADNAIRLRERLTSKYTNHILNVDGGELSTKWQNACGKWFVPRYFAKKSMRQMMGAYRTPFTDDDMNTVIRTLRDIADNQQLYDESSEEIQRIFGALAYYGQEQWDTMLQALAQLPTVYSLANELAQIRHIKADQALKEIADGATEGIPDKERWAEMIDAAKGIINSLSEIGTMAELPEINDNLCATLTPMVDRWENGIGTFREWYLWCKSRRDFKANHLQCVVDYINQGPHTGAEAAEAFAKGLYEALARQMIDSDESLRLFNGHLINDIIDKYRKVTARFQQLSKQELYSRLAANIPSQVMAAHENSEIGILKRNIKNGGRGTSIRKIIDQIPTLLPKLCPCMLMSPLSVAQYIDLDNEKFDIVIFDEASQMPTSEAVGAIARGKSLIVVGDPKQMPPTSFFATSAVGEEDAYIDDMESILDDCISLSIPSKYLTWHYRSKHESLISFSNSQYYDGRLLTFPSIDAQKSKVSLRMVEGVYDKGHSRSNISEARAVVDEVIHRLTDPETAQQSIGIVSFSKVQQDKIEDMLNEELAKRPDLEEKALKSAEPIFVKNLENVQGDERDVILFSIGYGPDSTGKVSMNFGPLNNAGGERRLNVAVSRAREEMIVFSSMRADQIDLRRTNSLGVYGLKKFLEYAENGTNTVLSAQQNTDQSNVIASQIAQAISEHGYETRLHVGRSEFKIDIAVVRPDEPSEFMLGILLDGPSYYSTKTVRDREVVQPTVLRNLNWEIMRIWTLDWYERRDKVINEIIKTLEIQKGRKTEGQKGRNTEGQKDRKTEVQKGRKTEIQKDRKTEGQKGRKAEGAQARPEEMESATEPSEPYVYADLGSQPNGGIDGLIGNARLLKANVDELIKTEQPITLTLLHKRIAKHWGIGRVTPKLQAAVELALSKCDVIATDNGNNGHVYWKDRQLSEIYSKYRTGSDRDIQDVPYVEIINAMKYAIDQQVAIEREDLKRLTCNLFGYTRKGSNLDVFTEYALNHLVSTGYINQNGTKAVKGRSAQSIVPNNERNSNFEF